MARLACCVPFCRRTTGRTDCTEWLCGDHWRMVPKDRRQVYGRYARQWRRYRCEEAGAAAWRLWDNIKHVAIERAAGI